MARLTPEQSAALKAKYAAKPPPVEAVEIPVDPANRQARLVAEEKQLSAKAAQDAQTAADKRRNVDMLLESQQTGADFSQEVARLNAEEDIKASAPPIYVGAFDPGLTTPLFGAVPPARPMNIAVPKAEAPGIMEAMRPQTMAPPNVAMQSANRTAAVFDDQAFMESIADLPEAGKKSAIATHKAFKDAFFKLREMNPVETGVTDEELLKELRQQIKDFEDRTGPTLTHGEVTSPTIGGALKRQVTPATLQIARPGALVYFSQLAESLQKDDADAAENTAVANLMKTGVPIMEPVPGNREGLERQTGTRPATPADAARTRADARKAYIEANPIPLEMLANRDELLANSEKSATGGTLFQKEYITGATAESSLSHALRNVFAPLNYVIAEGMDLMTPQSTRMREQAARPVGQKDMSPGAYNIATAGGFNKPIGDLWTYSPVEVVRDNAWFGQTFGLAADLLSFEVGAIGGLASGARAGLGAAKAAKVAGESRSLVQAAVGIREGVKTGVATAAKSIGLPSFVGQPQKAAFGSELIDKITGPVTRRTSAILAPGDVRLIGASDVAENYKALVAYEDEIARGGTHNTAMDAAKYAAIDSYAVKQMAKQGPSFSPAAFVKDSAAEYKEFKDIHETIKAVVNGASDVDLIKLRPYLKAGMTDSAAAAVIAKIGSSGAGELTRTTTIKNVVDAIKNNGSLENVAKAAAFDKGFKALDRTVGALEPGKEVIAITPRTFGTAKKADEVIKAAEKDQSLAAIQGLQESRQGKTVDISFKLGGRTVTDTGYKLSTDEARSFINILTNEANFGTMPKAAVNKAIQELNAKTISSKSLRELSYSVVDGVAEEIRAAEGLKEGFNFTGQGTFATTGLTNKAKAITYGEQTNSIKLAIEKISKNLENVLRSTEGKELAKLLDDVQLEEVRLAKSKVGQVDKILVNEFQALDDPAIAARYGLPPDANKSQKMAALTLGVKPTLRNKKTTMYNYLKSTLFGTTDLSASRLIYDFVGAKGYNYKTIEEIFNQAGLAEIDKIVGKYAALIKTPDDALRLLPQMTNEVEELTKAMQTVEAPSAKAFVGGRSTKIATERDAAIAAAKAERDAARPKALAERNAAKLKATEDKPALVNRANQIRSQRLSKVREERVAAKAAAAAARDAALVKQPRTEISALAAEREATVAQAKIDGNYTVGSGTVHGVDWDGAKEFQDIIDRTKTPAVAAADKAAREAWTADRAAIVNAYQEGLKDYKASRGTKGVDVLSAEFTKISASLKKASRAAMEAADAKLESAYDAARGITQQAVDKAAIEKKFTDDMNAIIDKSVADSKAIEAKHQANLENIETRYISDLEAANTNYSDVVDSVGSKYAADLEAANAKFAADTEAAERASVGYAAVGTATSKPAFLTGAFAGKISEPGIFKLTRPEEALIGTYARNKGDEIFADSLSSILQNDPLTTGANTRAIANENFQGLQIDKIMQRAVADQLSGGAPIESMADLLSIKGMSAILDRPIDPSSSTTTIREFFDGAETAPILSTLVEDVNATAAAVARKFGGGVPAVEYASELQQIANGNIKLSEIGDAPNPFSIRHALKAELGKEAKYGELQTELGKLAEEAASGNRSAVKASRYINALLDTTNSLFYNAILSYRPRFHGRNIISAPFIAHMTTGVGLNPSDVLRGARVLDPVSMKEAARSFADEGRGAQLVKDIKNDVIVVDKLGNQYSSADLYKLAVESGILKTELTASVDSRFLAEAATLGLGQSMTAKFPKTMSVLSYPGAMAVAEDNMFRLATVIHAIEKGDTVEGALQLGRRSLFDFGAATEFERKYVARKILFYNYFRNSVLQGVKTLLENPGRVIRQYKMATDITKMAVGDTDWNNLRFYGPMDAGVNNIAIEYAPSNRKEGRLTVLPNMPYADIAMISAGLLYSPMDFLAGQADLVTGTRDYGKGFLINKLSPGTRGVWNFISGQTMDDVKMKKNMLSPTHVAAAATFEKNTGVPAVQALTEMFNAKPRPALPGEAAYDGIVYELSPKDFDNYKMYLVKTIQYSGTSAAVNEWAKSYSGPELSGPTASGFTEALGMTSRYAADSPAALQRKAADLSTGMLEAGTAEKEVEAGLKRPKEPAASGRIK